MGIERIVSGSQSVNLSTNLDVPALLPKVLSQSLYGSSPPEKQGDVQHIEQLVLTYHRKNIWLTLRNHIHSAPPPPSQASFSYEVVVRAGQCNS